MSTFEIIDGPNADRVVDSFKYAYDRHAKVDVAFMVEEDHLTGLIKGRVVELRYENGAPGMFILTLDFVHGIGQRELFYNANKRIGHSN